MLTYLVLPIALTGLIAALLGSPWGASLVLAAAFFGRALDGTGVVPDTIVAETALLLIAFWGITAYLSSSRAHEGRYPYFPFAGAVLGALVGVILLPGVDFALFSVLGAMVFATLAAASDLTRLQARLVLLEPLRVLTVMVAAFWLMFHLS